MDLGYPLYPYDRSAIYEKLFESAPDAILVSTRDGKIVQVNAQAERMFGYSRNELIGEPVEILIPTHLRSGHKTHLQQYQTELRRRPMGTDLDLYGKRKDGTEFPVDILLSPTEADDGTVVLAVVRDISERKRAEQELRHSEQQLQGILDNSTAVVYLKDTSGRYLRVNRQFESIFGISKTDIPGKTDYDLVPRDRAEAVRRNDQSVLEAGTPIEFEEVVPQRDGLHTYISIKFPLFDVAGKPYAVGGMSTDITERKRAESALSLSEERYRLLVESVKDYAIFTLDTQGNVTSWNSGAERIQGFRTDEIMGQSASHLFPNEDAARGKLQKELTIAANKGQFEDEDWRVRKDGSRFWANVVVSALKDAAGQPRGFSVVTRDFTDRKRAEEALLLEISNVLVSNLDIRRLLAAIAASIRQVAHHDYASLALYDPEIKKLRLQVLRAPYDRDPAHAEMLVPIEGSPAGWVYRNREPLVLSDFESSRFNPETMERFRSMGSKSVCWLPLTSHGRVLGTLIIATRREDAFSGQQINLLMRVANQVAVALDTALALRQLVDLKDRLAEEKLYLEDEIRTAYNFEEIVGESATWKRILKQVETVAATDATVLIQGETGTGKELIARAIHDLSLRHERTFVKVNCAAIPTGLLESELFGHEKGAFTGAISQKIGRLELAHRGTLFLDEVGDIPLELQPKLLRALQEKEFERLGSTQTVPVDVRLIAATNRDLPQMMRDRQFRSDLFYRLNVFPINVPPLRERPEDIPILVHYFVQKHAQRMGKRIESIPTETMNTLMRWQWPGNVRELENLVERAVILSHGPVLHIPISELKPGEGAEVASSATLEVAERDHIIRVLRETKGVIGGPSGAAARLGIKRTTLNSKMRKLGISRRDL